MTTQSTSEQPYPSLLEELLARLLAGMEMEPGSSQRESTITEVLCEYLELRNNTPPDMLPSLDIAFDPYRDIFCDFAKDLAAQAVRKRSVPLLQYAVNSLLLDRGASDGRDFVTAAALVANSADVLGLSPQSLLDSADSRGTPTADKETIRSLFQTPRVERRIGSFGYAASGSGSTFSYKRL